MNKIVKIGILAVFLMLSCVQTVNAYYDNQAPFIQSVFISDRYVNEGDTIFVTATVTDNYAVSQVTADGIRMSKYYGNVYRASVKARYGTNNVLVVAQDWVGNSVLKRSISYSAWNRPTRNMWSYWW